MLALFPPNHMTTGSCTSLLWPASWVFNYPGQRSQSKFKVLSLLNVYYFVLSQLGSVSCTHVKAGQQWLCTPSGTNLFECFSFAPLSSQCHLSPAACSLGPLLGCSEPCRGTVTQPYLGCSRTFGNMEPNRHLFPHLGFSREAKTENKKYEKQWNC